jgi:HSP20 family protein
MSPETTLRKHDASTPEKVPQRRTVAPPVDVFENKDELLIVADLPGVAQDDVLLNLDKNQLTIEGRRPGATDDDAFDYRRSFVVPQGIDADKIAARLQNGVLRLTLPKAAALRPRQIQVKTG